MPGNVEWSPEENAFCLIELIHWHGLKSKGMKDAFLDQLLKKDIFKARNKKRLEDHFNYLYKLVTGTIEDIDGVPTKDKYLVNLYL